MMVIVAGVMIGLCLAIMEHAVRKVGKHRKGRCMDRQPKVGKGDRVRIINDSVYGQIGKYGTVTEVGSSGLDFDFKPDCSEATYWITADCGDEWELLERAKEQTITQHAFKVGDRVRILRQPSHFIDNCVGKTGTIGDMWWEGGKNRCYTVMYDNELTSNSYPADHLVLQRENGCARVMGDS